MYYIYIKAHELSLLVELYNYCHTLHDIIRINVDIALEIQYTGHGLTAK